MNEKMSEGLSKFLKPFSIPALNFILLFMVNALVYVEVLGALMDILPPRLDWISNVAFTVCLVSGLVTTIIGIKKTDGKLDTIKSFVEACVVTLIGMVILVGLYAVSLTLAPERYVTKEQLESVGLNPVQVAQVQTYLDDQGYITLTDLDTLILSPDQKRSLTNLMTGLGFITQREAEQIAQAQIALVATQTAVAKISSCYITPELNFGTVAVRKLPADTADAIGSFSPNQNLYVVGHSGGRVNQDKWWLVEFMGDGSRVQYGWVASWVVTEINELECVKIQPAPGY